MNETQSSMTAREARQALYDLLDESLTRAQALERILDIGARYLRVRHAHVADVDTEANRWEAIASTDPPDGPFPEGLAVDLDATYCRRTFERATPLAVEEASHQGWADDVAYRTHQLETYIGIRFDVFEQPYGTLCFVDPEPRGAAVTELEQVFLEIAAQVLGQVIESTHHHHELGNRDRLIEVLNRVLRHNLRNDLNVVIGNAELLEEVVPDAEEAVLEAIVSTATGLLGLAEKARRLDRLTREVPVARPTDVVPAVERAVETVARRHPDANIDADLPDEALALAAPQLERAIVELLENAARHAGPSPSPVVELRRDATYVTIVISDDGPGLPRDEQRVLTSGDETPLEHGSGLGLFLVFWLVTQLEGHLSVEVDGGTTIGVHLERSV